MPSVAKVVDSIAERTGIAKSVVAQAGRRMREDELLPNSSGSIHAQVSPEGVALLLFASLTTPSARAATKCALEYAQLTFDGGYGVDENGEAPTTLLKHFAALIKTVWTEQLPSYPFVSLTLDLMQPGATTITQAVVDGKVMKIHSTYLRPDNDPDNFRAQIVRREVTLTADVFYNIVGDLRHVDEGIRRQTMPFVVTKIGGRYGR